MRLCRTPTPFLAAAIVAIAATSVMAYVATDPFDVRSGAAFRIRTTTGAQSFLFRGEGQAQVIDDGQAVSLTLEPLDGRGDNDNVAVLTFPGLDLKQRRFRGVGSAEVTVDGTTYEFPVRAAAILRQNVDGVTLLRVRIRGGNGEAGYAFIGRALGRDLP